MPTSVGAHLLPLPWRRRRALARQQPPGSLAPASPAPASAVFTVNVKTLPSRRLWPSGSCRQDHLSPAALSPGRGCLEGAAGQATVRLGLDFSSTIRRV